MIFSPILSILDRAFSSFPTGNHIPLKHSMLRSGSLSGFMHYQQEMITYTNSQEHTHSTPRKRSVWVSSLHPCILSLPASGGSNYSIHSTFSHRQVCHDGFFFLPCGGCLGKSVLAGEDRRSGSDGWFLMDDDLHLILDHRGLTDWWRYGCFSFITELTTTLLPILLLPWDCVSLSLAILSGFLPAVIILFVWIIYYLIHYTKTPRCLILSVQSNTELFFFLSPSSQSSAN